MLLGHCSKQEKRKDYKKKGQRLSGMLLMKYGGRVDKKQQQQQQPTKQTLHEGGLSWLQASMPAVSFK